MKNRERTFKNNSETIYCTYDVYRIVPGPVTYSTRVKCARACVYILSAKRVVPLSGRRPYGGTRPRVFRKATCSRFSANTVLDANN